MTLFDTDLPTTVQLGSSGVTVGDVIAVARHDAHVELTDEAREQ